VPAKQPSPEVKADYSAAYYTNKPINYIPVRKGHDEPHEGWYEN